MPVETPKGKLRTDGWTPRSVPQTVDDVRSFLSTPHEMTSGSSSRRAGRRSKQPATGGSELAPDPSEIVSRTTLAQAVDPPPRTIKVSDTRGRTTRSLETPSSRSSLFIATETGRAVDGLNVSELWESKLI